MEIKLLLESAGDILGVVLPIMLVALTFALVTEIRYRKGLKKWK